ncbi:hypothetical protein J3459_021612 [Metarhizium acridum]|nr:hypothetical protein J3459_021612 [Metarhizium acridum]
MVVVFRNALVGRGHTKWGSSAEASNPPYRPGPDGRRQHNHARLAPGPPTGRLPPHRHPRPFAPSDSASARAGKRWQSTADGAQQQQHQSWFKRAWESEVGIKTVHFWAPVMKVRCAKRPPLQTQMEKDN